MSRPEPVLDRLPPYSDESERGLLGCLLEDDGLVARFMADFPQRKLAFYMVKHQTICERIVAMEEAGDTINPVTLGQRLREQEELELVGGLEFLTGLIDAAPSAANYGFHASVVQDKFNRRRIIQEAFQLTEDAWNESADEKLLVQRASEFLRQRVRKGGIGGLYSIAEIESHYSARAKSLSEVGLSLSRWVPSLDRLRVLLPGNLIMVLASTGVGKTAILSNLALAASPQPTLFLQLELPKEDVFERMVALKSKIPCYKVEKSYMTGLMDGAKFYDSQFPNLIISDEARLSIPDIEAKIMGFEIKTGFKPKIVLIDYMGLVQGRSSSRYDRFSNIAEDLRVLAKETNTIVVAASQVGRKKDDDSPEVGLFDGKETGSIENSASLVLGAWRNPKNAEEMTIKVLKCNKGGSGIEVLCNYNLDTLAITEQSRYSNHENS